MPLSLRTGPPRTTPGPTVAALVWPASPTWRAAAVRKRRQPAETWWRLPLAVLLGLLLARVGLAEAWTTRGRTRRPRVASAAPLAPAMPSAPVLARRDAIGHLAAACGPLFSRITPLLLTAVAMAALGWVLAAATLTWDQSAHEAAETPLPPLGAIVATEPASLQGAPSTTTPREPVVPPRATTARHDPPLPPRVRTNRPEPSVPPVPVVKEFPLPADARLSFLPGWVESEEGSRVWAGPEDGARLLRQVDQGTRMRVLGAKQARLHVDYPGGTGWVNVSGVIPAGAPGGWLRSQGQISIWASADERWPLYLLPAASQLHVEEAKVENGGVQVQKVENGRVRVHAYDQYGRALLDGWVLRQGLQPMQIPGWATKGAQPAPNANIEKLIGDRGAFIEKVGAAAREAAKSTGIPASVTVAQAILESSWGQSRLAREANNYFGIKALSGIGPAGVVWMPTVEVVDGEAVRVVDVFRAYHSLDQSVREKHRFLTNQPIYRSALQAKDDPVEFTYRIWLAGYSTDPDYVAKVVSLIRQYDLTRFDRG